MKYLIIGCGPAGMHAAYKLDELDKNAEITLINSESNLPYSRILITFLLEKKVEEEDLFIFSEEFLQKDNINYYQNKSVEEIDSDNKKVKLNDGTALNYDKLLIAAGGDPKRPSVKGIESDRIFTIRTIDDIKTVKAKMETAEKCAVLGGGLVSLKMAQALKRQGIGVKVLIRSPRVLSQVLDEESAVLIADHLEENGIELLTGTQIEEIVEEKKGLVFNTNKGKISSDFAVIGKGVSPNMDFLDKTSVKTDWGILSDEYLQTEEKDIFAAGDVVENYNIAQDSIQLNSIWPDAVLQGITAAENMAGKFKKYPGNINMNAVDIFSLPLIAMGRVKDVENLETVKYENKSEKKFVKLFFNNDLLVGAVLINDVENAGFYKQLIAKRKIIKDRETLLNKNNLLANYIFWKEVTE
ncbi:pyridine nucleotide-disulfide oxidoreductase [Halanaerobium sp. DL-01]|uniref:NAD(P)/FAD-dependent oxidoreductase n=1 Tax=Halanaerobium sp. DL-01 TaxID=1653064 RepID=UPI000E1B3081|nr:FAD-dependent oxidoreductase [Halanaerobium sp. DL-01]RCW79960.1 pyridine nucleotide-disulfide oxidoreductase [Halanaerobium sp. DL-01]